MDVTLLIGELLLAAVLAIAGVAKLLDLEGSRRAVAGFGVPPRLAGPLGTLLPAAELGTAALLAAGALASVPAWLGGLSAVILLAAFSAAIAASLARGRAPDCHCFGQLHSAPAGLGTLARNGALLALAAFVASGGEPAPTAVAGAAALAMLAVAILRSGAIERGRPASAGGLHPGTPAPGFQLPDLAGQVHTLDSLRADGQPVLLLFSDPDCGPCTALAPEVARWQRDHADELTIAVVERNRDDRCPDEHGRRGILFQRESEVADLYGALGTPTAVLIDRDGAIAGPVAAGSTQIEAVVAGAVDGFEPSSPSTLTVHRGLVPPLRRRELLVRGAGAWTAASAFLALPLRATAGIRSKLHRRVVEPCENVFDCPDPSPGRMSCVEGRCRCEEGLTRCDPDEATTKRCFNLQTDEDHCGGCNRPCAADEDECCEGICGYFGFTRCNCDGDECGDDEVCGTSADGTNTACVSCATIGYRRCGNVCANPEIHRCCGNRLYQISTLPPGEWHCCGPARNRRFVNVAESERNCGRCDHRCAPDEFCFEGRCRRNCPRGLKKCGNTCADRGSDPRNCGGCGVRCEGPFDTGECCNGSCCDINGDTCCPGGCTNTSLNDENCGACGNVCKPGEFCRFGVCTCPLGATCG